MKSNEETPSVNVKRKNIALLLEYCVENKIDFSVKSLISRSEEFEIEFNNISNTKKAVALGMYLKELRLELSGIQPTVPAVAVTPSSNGRASKKAAAKENGHSKEEPASISFEGEKLEFGLEATPN